MQQLEMAASLLQLWGHKVRYLCKVLAKVRFPLGLLSPSIVYMCGNCVCVCVKQERHPFKDLYIKPYAHQVFGSAAMSICECPLASMINTLEHCNCIKFSNFMEKNKESYVSPQVVANIYNVLIKDLFELFSDVRVLDFTYKERGLHDLVHLLLMLPTHKGWGKEGFKNPVLAGFVHMASIVMLLDALLLIVEQYKFAWFNDVMQLYNSKRDDMWDTLFK